MCCRNFFALLSIGLTLGLISCGPKYQPPGRYDFSSDRYYEADFDQVWAAVIETVTDHEIPVENLEKASGFLRSDRLGSPFSSAVDCGEKRISNYNDIRWQALTESPDIRIDHRLTVFVREMDGGRIRVRLRVSMVGYDWVGKGDPVTCESTGVLEALLFQEIEARLEAS